MQLMRLGPLGAERPAVRTPNGDIVDLASLTDDIDGPFLEENGIDRVREALDRGGLPQVDMTGVRVGAPIARPSAVLCIGMNYEAHAAESGDAAPEVPVLFLKHPNTVIGPFDDVRVPIGAEKTDWEVELGVVVGRTARYLDSPDEALNYIAGFVVSNDVSERTFQTDHSGGQWSKGKCCETFNPLGPYLVSSEDIANPQNLRLRSWVNGSARQDSTTKDMVFSVAHLVWHLSHYLVLEAGDLINTGTPQGVALSGRFPYLRPGDSMELEIEGLGRMRQHVVDVDQASRFS